LWLPWYPPDDGEESEEIRNSGSANLVHAKVKAARRGDVKSRTKKHLEFHEKQMSLFVGTFGLRPKSMTALTQIRSVSSMLLLCLPRRNMPQDIPWAADQAVPRLFKAPHMPMRGS